MNVVMRVVDTRLPALLRGARPLLGMFVGLPQPACRNVRPRWLDFVVIDN